MGVLPEYRSLSLEGSVSPRTRVIDGYKPPCG